MKLLHCLQCRDTRKLHMEEVACRCGACKGRYLEDGLHAEVSGPAVTLGIANDSLNTAIRMERDRPQKALGYPITAFVIPEASDRVARTDRDSQTTDGWLSG